MYNRYVRNDEGVYRHMPAAQSPAPDHHTPQEEQKPPHNRCRTATCGPPPSSPGSLLGKDGLLSGILGKLRLDEIDTGDLLLLVLLFLLFREGEDDELLIALGLLLIL